MTTLSPGAAPAVDDNPTRFVSDTTLSDAKLGEADTTLSALSDEEERRRKVARGLAVAAGVTSVVGLAGGAVYAFEKYYIKHPSDSGKSDIAAAKTTGSTDASTTKPSNGSGANTAHNGTNGTDSDDSGSSHHGHHSGDSGTALSASQGEHNHAAPAAAPHTPSPVTPPVTAPVTAPILTTVASADGTPVDHLTYALAALDNDPVEREQCLRLLHEYADPSTSAAERQNLLSQMPAGLQQATQELEHTGNLTSVVKLVPDPDNPPTEMADPLMTALGNQSTQEQFRILQALDQYEHHSSTEGDQNLLDSLPADVRQSVLQLQQSGHFDDVLGQVKVATNYEVAAMNTGVSTLHDALSSIPDSTDRGLAFVAFQDYVEHRGEPGFDREQALADLPPEVAAAVRTMETQGKIGDVSQVFGSMYAGGEESLDPTAVDQAHLRYAIEKLPDSDDRGQAVEALENYSRSGDASDLAGLAPELQRLATASAQNGTIGTVVSALSEEPYAADHALTGATSHMAGTSDASEMTHLLGEFQTLQNVDEMTPDQASRYFELKHEINVLVSEQPEDSRELVRADVERIAGQTDPTDTSAVASVDHAHALEQQIEARIELGQREGNTPSILSDTNLAELTSELSHLQSRLPQDEQAHLQNVIAEANPASLQTAHPATVPADSTPPSTNSETLVNVSDPNLSLYASNLVSQMKDIQQETGEPLTDEERANRTIDLNAQLHSVLSALPDSEKAQFAHDVVVQTGIALHTDGETALASNQPWQSNPNLDQVHETSIGRTTDTPHVQYADYRTGGDSSEHSAEGTAAGTYVATEPTSSIPASTDASAEHSAHSTQDSVDGEQSLDHNSGTSYSGNGFGEHDNDSSYGTGPSTPHPDDDSVPKDNYVTIHTETMNTESVSSGDSSFTHTTTEESYSTSSTPETSEWESTSTPTDHASYDANEHAASYASSDEPL